MEENIDKNSKKYSNIKQYISIANIFYEVAFLLIMIFFISDIFVFWVKNITSIRYFGISIYSFLFLIFHAFFCLPLNFYSDYIVEHKFNLSTENIFGWLKFQFKGLLFSIILGIPLIVFFYVILDYFSVLWWVVAATCSFIIALIISYIFPYIISFFYKLIPLEKEELFFKIKNVLQKGGLELKGLYRINIGERTKKANAALTGFGNTKKVLLSDTLLDSNDFNKKDSAKNKDKKSNDIEFTNDEITSITAHEVGHYVHNHIWKMILLEGLLNYVLFYIIYLVSANVIDFLSYGRINDIVNLPVLLLILTFLSFFTTPLNNFFSRFFEYQADAYAVSVTDKLNYRSALDKLSKVNLADKNPPRIIEILFHSHPSIEHRIQKINNFIDLK